MDIVFRLEDDKGLGPYRHFSSYDLCIECNHRGCPQHPSPEWDGIPSVAWEEEDDVRFGFKSLCDLINWFDYDIRVKLDGHDIRVSVYSGEVIARGYRQLVFRPHNLLWRAQC